VVPRSARTPETHHYEGKRASLALALLCGMVALIGGGLFLAEGLSGAGLVGLVVGIGAIAGWVLLVRRLRARGVRIEPGRLGRVSGGGSTRWCDLDAVALATVHRYAVVFGGRQVNLVLWTAAGGDRGLTARFARAGMSDDQRQALAAAEAAAGTGLAPFVVELSDLPEGAADAIVEHVRHLL
jgi:hypothetical protein